MSEQNGNSQEAQNKRFSDYMGELAKQTAAAADGVGGLDNTLGGGGGKGLSAAAQRADQGLIDLALAFADFHDATGGSILDFEGLVQAQKDRDALDKTFTQTTIDYTASLILAKDATYQSMVVFSVYASDRLALETRMHTAAADLRVKELEAADSGFQLQKSLVGIAEDAAKSGRTMEQESVHLWQSIASGIQSAFSALNGSQTKEGAYLQLQIDRAQLDYDNASRHGANQAELTALQKHITQLQDEQKIRDDNTRIQKDLFEVANQMLPTDQQKLTGEQKYITAQQNATTTLVDVTATAALQQIAQENYIAALGNASGALGGASASDPFSAAQKHWINGVAIGKGESMPYPGFASGTPYVPYTGLAMVHQGERIIPADQNRAGGGGTVIHVHIGEWHQTGDIGAGIASASGVYN